MRATSSAGTEPSVRSRGTTASHTSSAQARSRSASDASITGVCRGPSGAARPSRIACHTAAPRAAGGAQSTSSASESDTSMAGDTTGEITSPSCHADSLIASTA
jgi:hypothetical protein